MRRLLFFLFFLMLALPAFTQDMLQKMKSDEVITIDEKEYWVHQVKRGQTLYMISKAYGVDVNAIIEENPEVREGLQSGMKIRIPKKPDPVKKIKTPAAKPEITPEMPPTVPAPEIKPFVPCGSASAIKDAYSVALMLPLYLGDVTAIDANAGTSVENENLRSLQFLPFYEGFSMALDSLKKLGYKMKVFVYDVDKDTIKTKKILKNPEMKNMDLIIGLLYHNNFRIVADFAEKNEIPVVNPITERDQVLTGNPFVIKVRPSLKSQPESMMKYLMTNFSNENVIVVRNKQEKIGNIPDSVKARLNAKIASGYTDVVPLLRKEINNVIVLYSDNKSFILDVVTKLNELRNEYQITLAGLPRWDLIDGIENEYLVNLKTRVFAPFFINYHDPEVKKFVRNYQEKYKTDPEALAFQGFDVAIYFSNALHSFGKTLLPCITGMKMKTLETSFDFSQRNPQNGFENVSWEIYMYDNYKLVPGK